MRCLSSRSLLFIMKMIPELRVCIATAMWKANRNLGLRVDIVKMIQLVLNELFTQNRASNTA